MTNQILKTEKMNSLFDRRTFIRSAGLGVGAGVLGMQYAKAARLVGEPDAARRTRHWRSYTIMNY